MKEKSFNEIFSSRLRYYLNNNDMSQAELAQKLQVGTTTVSDWINGRKTPRMAKIDMMCQLFGCNRSDLINEAKDSHGVRMVPLFEAVSAGTGAFADSNVIDYIPIPEDLKGNLYAVKVRGDSMTPLIMDGDILIVDKDSRVQNMDTVIATVNGDDGFVKRLARYTTGIALVSNNPAYPPLYFSMEDVENKPVLIQGRVKRSIRDI